MAIEYLKKAAKTPETESGAAREVAERMLADIERRGESAVREYAQKLDGWTGEILVSTSEIERRTAVERALADSEQRWQLAVAGTNDGIWDWNIATAELFMSDRWLEMLGYGHDELPARPELFGAAVGSLLG